jgi:hypothetical protein
MLKEKAIRGEDIIVSSDGKTIQRIPARQLATYNAHVITHESFLQNIEYTNNKQYKTK